MSKRRHKSLSAKVTRDGVLTIEIGIDVNAHSALYSPFACELVDRGFALDVKRALTDEREDGSSLLTDMLDAAARKAVEDGSEFFMGKDEAP